MICEYLDAQHGGARIIPDGAARWNALRLQSLCDGILDAAVLCRYEGAVRPQALRWQSWIDGQFVKIRNGLDALEREPPRGLLIRSAKPSGFIAGADVNEFTALKDADQTLALVRRGQQLFDRIDGDYFAILGLPMLGLLSALAREGAVAA